MIVMKKQLISVVLLLVSLGWAVPSLAQQQVGRQIAELSRGLTSSTRKFIPINLDIWKPLPPEMAQYSRSVFRARSLSPESEHTFSGVVFKTQYEGKEGVYGVVAAHAVAPDLTTNRFLREKFTAEVFDGNGFIAVEAELVQISSRTMLDLALVKFRPEDEKLFTPLSLSLEEIPAEEQISGLGFGQGQWVSTSNRRLLQNAPLSLRTSFFLPLADRPGLCGSAVLNKKKELLGIHIGSTWDGGLGGEDIGYATPAKFLNTLVEAYHNDGEAMFPLEINNQIITWLNIDEFVSYVRLKNSRGNIIWRRAVHMKFPYNEISALLPQAQYIELSINKAVWTGNLLREETLNPRQVEYDLFKRRIIKESR